jgi:rhodanese-related sulfurtransferase
MSLALIIGFVALLCVGIFLCLKQTRNKGELERHSISAEELHSLRGSVKELLLFDVRQALDLLAYPEQIPGAQRIPPEEVLERPERIPRDKDVVVYCTCPDDKTSRIVLTRALALGFSRVKFLRGGLAAWKGMGFPVEPYTGTLAFSSVASPKR